MSSDYRKSLREQAKNASRSSVAVYLRKLYGFVRDELSILDEVLEVGSGPGISSIFLPEFNILRTDILDFEESGVLGGVDCLLLPFADGRFKSTLAVDTLHHTSSPTKALMEMKRVSDIEGGGKIILIEPYVSPFSYLIYRVFHFEKVSNPWLSKYIEPMVSSDANDGDQAISHLLFLSSNGRAKINDIFPSSEYVIRIKLFSFLDFFATGGLTRPLAVSDSIIRFLSRLERRIPPFMMRILASRVMVVIEKR